MNKYYFKDIYKDFFDTSLQPKIEVKEKEVLVLLDIQVMLQFLVKRDVHLV